MAHNGLDADDAQCPLWVISGQCLNLSYCPLLLRKLAFVGVSALIDPYAGSLIIGHS